MTSDGPLARYRALLSAGRLKPDSEQAEVAEALQALHDAIGNYQPAVGSGFFSTFLSFGRMRETPRGLYIHGAVGRGKSLLMDIFYESAPTRSKRRVHFNSFMAETHARLHEWRNLDDGERARRPEFVREAEDDPIAPVAKRIALDSWLLCFDEFQVTDVADAMILGRMFERLLAFGVVIVATSNTPPERLYEGGLNRQLFLPFIDLVVERFRVLELDGGKDYREGRLAGLQLYNMPLGADADAAMDGAWRRLVNGAPAASRALAVLGRELKVPHAADGVARFEFGDLCGKPLGPSDYIALAENFHTVMIDGIPRLRPDQNNEARRFGTLIDTLYDEKIKLICSAAAPPGELFDASGKNAWFARTASRLAEMQSEDYLKLRPRKAAR